MVLATHEWLPPTGAAADVPIALLVHGVTGWHRTWWRVGPALAEHGWRVVAVDLRGHGHSPPIVGLVTVRDLAADVIEIAEALGGAIDLLVGHSLGGAVALEMATARPDLVKRLVVEDPPAISRVGDQSWLDNLRRGIEAAREDPAGQAADALDRNPTWLPEDARQDVESRALADADALVATYEADIQTRVVELLQAMTLPTLLLLADPADSGIPVADRERLAPRLPRNVQLFEVHSGHVIHRDRFDEYVAAIIEWSGGPRPS